MAAELRLANTCITTLDSTLTNDVIYERFTNILNKNEIDEVGILPFLPEPENTASESNELPVYPFIVQERGTKLGIPIFCWVPLINASYAVLKDACRTPTLEPESASQEWWTDSVKSTRVMESTSCLMILCPDSFTAMNARKRLILQGLLDPKKEIEFLNAILTFPRNCKSSGPWHHRKWLLEHIYGDSLLDPVVVEQHLKVCQLAAEHYPKCYYAWTMRHWLVEHLGRHWWTASLQGQFDHHLLQPLLEEYKRMRDHVGRNISDHSALQHLQQCMLQLGGKWVVQRLSDSPNQSHIQAASVGSGSDRLHWTRLELASRRKRLDEWVQNQSKECLILDSNSTIKNVIPSIGETDMDDFDVEVDKSAWASFQWVAKLWISELRRTRYLITTYPGHESLWYHLRFIYYGLQWLDCETNVDHIRSSIPTEEDSHTPFVSFSTEKTFVKDFEADERQAHLATNYLTWVERL